MSEWTEIDDAKIHHVWQCPECDRIITVRPSFYEHMGNPVCDGEDCDCDLVYLRTEIHR